MKIKKLFQQSTYWLGVIAVGLVVGMSLQFVQAWTEPTVDPPGGNVEAPLNTSINDQIKSGNLQVNGLAINGTGTVLLVPNGNVGIGTLDPQGFKLYVAGKARADTPLASDSDDTVATKGYVDAQQPPNGGGECNFYTVQNDCDGYYCAGPPPSGVKHPDNTAAKVCNMKNGGWPYNINIEWCTGNGKSWVFSAGSYGWGDVRVCGSNLGSVIKGVYCCN